MSRFTRPSFLCWPEEDVGALFGAAVLGSLQRRAGYVGKAFAGVIADIISTLVIVAVAVVIVVIIFSFFVITVCVVCRLAIRVDEPLVIICQQFHISPETSQPFAD